METYHIGFEHARTCLYYYGGLAGARFLYGLAIGGLLLVVGGNEYAATRTVSVYGATLTTTLPCLYIEVVDELFAYVGGEVDGDADAVVYPLLDATLHLYLLEPVDIVGGSLVVGAFGYHGVDFLLGVALGGVVALGLHPSHELGMVYDELFE